MTKPTITYGHGIFDDLTDDTDWALTDSGLGAAKSILYGDFLKITGTCNAAGNEYAYVEKDVGDLKSNNYPTFLLRWATSEDEEPGLAAGAQILFTVGDPQQILPLSFSTKARVATGTVTSDKTIDKIRLYADDVPDTLATGEHSDVFDFLLICQGIFTFPKLTEVRLRSSNRYADIEIPGRVGDITQNLGAKSLEIVLTGDVKSDTGWGNPLLEKLYQIQFEAHKQPWQWFTSDLIDCKVTVRDFNAYQIGRDSQRVWELTLKKHDGHCGSDDWVWDYYGIG